MAIDDYLRLTGRRPGQFLFAGRGDRAGLTTRQYARFVQEWVALRAVQLLLGHSKNESTVRYLGIEVDDAIEIAEKIDI